MIDVHFNDPQAANIAQIHEAIRDGSFTELMGNIECIDIVVLSDIHDSLHLASEPPSRLQTGNINVTTTRPTSSESSLSSSTFLSNMTPLNGSRPQTGDSNSDQAIYQLICDAEWMPSPESQEIKKSFDKLSENIVKNGSIRPATAITLMKVSGKRNMMFIPKSRPATAHVLMRDIKSHLERLDGSFDSLKSTDQGTKMSKNNIKFDSKCDLFIGKQEACSSPVNSPIIKRTSLPIKNPRLPSNIKKSSKNEKHNRKNCIPLLMSSITSCVNSMTVEDKKQDSLIYPQRNSSHCKNVTKPTSQPKATDCDQFLHFSSSNPQIRIKTASKKRATCCEQCKRKLGPAQVFTCKCKKTFCGDHRYWDRHACTHDYKSEGRLMLYKDNPVFKREKIIKIE